MYGGRGGGRGGGGGEWCLRAQHILRLFFVEYETLMGLKYANSGGGGRGQVALGSVYM